MKTIVEIKPIPKVGDERIKKQFLFRSKTLPIKNHSTDSKVQVKRWLEFVEIYQEFHLYRDGGEWVDYYWNDINIIVKG